MQVNICVAVAEPAIKTKKVAAIYELSSLCKDFFHGRNYSTEIECIIIGFVLIRTIPNYEHWFKEKKPRYVLDRTTKSPLSGEMITVRKTFSYEIKPSDELIAKFIMASDSDTGRFIAKECIISLDKLDKIPKKIKDFDKERFKTDFQEFFKLHSLID